jgi:hypothetical protein
MSVNYSDTCREFQSKSFLLLLSCFIWFNVQCKVSCDILAYEDFDYGNSGLNGQAGGIGFGGPWVADGIETNGSPLLGPPAYGYEFARGRVEADMVGRTAKRRLGFDIELDPASPKTYYFSILFKRLDAINEGTGEWLSLLRLEDADGNTVCTYGIGSDEAAFVQSFGNPERNVTSAPHHYQIGKTYLCVAKLVANPDHNDVMYIKIYEPNTLYFSSDITFRNCDAMTAFDGSSVLTHIGFDFGSSQNYIYIDELRIGECFHDAVNKDFAPIFAYEDFDYGSSGLDGQSGGTGFGGSWNASGVETGSSSLAAPAGYGYTPIGGAVQANMSERSGSRELGFSIPLDPAPGDRVIYYFSALFSIHDENGNQSSGEYFQILEFLNDAGEDVVSYGVSSSQQAAVTLNGTSAYTGVDYIEKEKTYLLVGKLLARGERTPQYYDSRDAGFVKVFKVGADTVYNEPKYDAYWDATVYGNSDKTINKLAFQFGINLTRVSIDEIRIGTTWQQVVGNDVNLIEPVSNYIRDVYLHVDPPEADKFDRAAQYGLMNIKPVILPEGENFWGDNLHMGWPVAAMNGDTLIMQSRRNIYHSAGVACRAIYPNNKDEYSGGFYCRSEDAGKSWGPMIDINPFFDNSNGIPVGGMSNIGVNEDGEFFIKNKGAIISDDNGKSWALYEDAFADCQADYWEMGPRVVNHPVFGMLMFNSSNYGAFESRGHYSPPWHTYIRRSQNGGVTWDDMSWDTSIEGGSDYTWPMEPAAVTWGPGHILLISREHNPNVASDGMTWAMSQHLYTYENGDEFAPGDIVFETKRSNIEGNLNVEKWANDTADVALNPLTNRIEVLQSARYGGGPGYDGNSTEVDMFTLNLWSIDPDELLSGSNLWRFEGTILLRNEHMSPGFNIDGLHPGAAVMDVENGVQHIFVYAGGHACERTGVFQIDRTLNTGQLSAFLKSEVPNCRYTKRIDINSEYLVKDVHDSYITVMLTASAVDYGQFKTDASDLYFTDSQQYIMPHKILKWDTNAGSYVIVRVPLLDASAGNNHIYMHWGDGDAHFHQHDEFADPGEGSLTVSFWVKNNTSGGLYYMVNKGNDSSSDEAGWSVFRDTDVNRTLRFRLQDGSSCNMPGFSDISAWHHVVAVIDRGQGQAKLYVDNAFVDSVNISALGDIVSLENLTMENSPYGDVEDIRIVRSVLSSAEIEAVYSAGRNGYTYLSFADLPTVTITAIDTEASETEDDPARFVITRTGSTDTALTVYYYLSGTADNSIDYEKLGGCVTIPAGISTANIDLVPICDRQADSVKTVTLTLLDGVDYGCGAAVSDTITIDNGDFNNVDIAPSPYGDCVVNFLDFSTFSISWKSSSWEPNYNELCDFFPDGGDGVIDYLDLVILARNWLLH